MVLVDSVCVLLRVPELTRSRLADRVRAGLKARILGQSAVIDRGAERRFGVRWEPAGNPCGASLWAAAYSEAGAGLLRARSAPPG
jgi:hypothetical protein